MRMRRVLLLALPLALVLLVIGLVAVAPWDSGGSGNQDKPTLLEHVADGLRSRGAPPQYIRCLTDQLNLSLTDDEVKQAYAELPSGAAGVEGLDLKYFVNPATVKKFRQSGLTCARRLVASGEFTPREVIKLLRGLTGDPNV